jgi:micrococcal nuclease
MFEYRGHVVRVYDGDSIWCTVDLGFAIQHGSTARPVPFRLAGIDTPELRGPQKDAGRIVADWLRDRIESTDVVLRTHSPNPGDKYGRYLAEVWTLDGQNLNQMMIDLGFAHAYDGGTKPPWSDAELAAIVANGYAGSGG